MAISEGIKWYYDLCGARGLGVAALFRTFGRPKKLAIIPPGLNHPVLLRLGTSDFCAYKDVLISQEKQYDPFLPDFKPKTIVDGGAHIGMASLSLARRYPSAKIVAVEPEPENFALLVKNVSRHKQIFPIQAALWKRDEEIRMGPSAAHVKGAFEVNEAGTTRVRGMTIETLMKEVGISWIDLLKLDVEGAEAEIFQNAAWIKDVQTIAIELHDRIKPGCRSSVEAAAKDFQCRERGEVTFFIRATRSAACA